VPTWIDELEHDLQDFGWLCQWHNFASRTELWPGKGTSYSFQILAVYKEQDAI